MEELNMIMEKMNNVIEKIKERDEGSFELAAAYTSRGAIYSQIELYDKSISDFDEGIKIMERIIAGDRLLDENILAKAYAGRGLTYYMIGELNLALPDLNNSIEIYERIQRISGQLIDDSMLFNLYIARSSVFNETFDYMDEAISDCRKSIKIAENLIRAGKVFDEDGLAMAHMGVGVSCDQKEEFYEANEHYTKCIKIWEQMIKEGKELSDKDNLATAYMNRGSNYFSMGDNQKSLADHNKSVSIREQWQKEGVQQDIFHFAIAYRNRAMPYMVEGNTIAAINDNISAMYVLKGAFEERRELQEFYYDTLKELLEWISDENDNVLFDKILQEFLYSMQSLPKTEEAEEAQNSILRTIV